MAFLDNSGDIILDAVLTDTGRLRLAKGDGSFKIAKFVLADDEINYGLYDKNNSSGSAYYDLEILQTPIFEAFTNNASVVKNPLLSISRTNLLYLPVMKINDNSGKTGATSAILGGGSLSSALTVNGNTINGSPFHSSGLYLVSVDKDTADYTNTTSWSGIFDGYNKTSQNYIRIDQGIDSTELSAAESIDSFLKETQYIIEIDNRLGKVVAGGTSAGQAATPSFVDDDNIASYYFTLTDTLFVEEILTNQESLSANQVISGPRGTCLGFQMAPSLSLQTSTFLFTTLGSTLQLTIGGVTRNYYYIDTNVVVRGITTGGTITVPIRLIKYLSTT